MNGLVGRGDDLAVLEGFLDRGPSAGARTLLIEGPAGIGKTSLWTEGVVRARRRGFRVLAARPARADATLGFQALADLLSDSVPGLIDALPPHQRDALRAALEGGESSAGVRALYAGVLSVLRDLVGDDGLAIAIDDLQWLDADTAGALSFALRRLHDREIRLLLARRQNDTGGLHPWELLIDSERLELGPLDAEQTQRLVHERLGLALSRSQTRRLHQISGGNPLFGLELGRVLGKQPDALDRERIMLPDRVEFLLEERVRALSEDARSALLAVTLTGDSPVHEIIAVVGAGALDDGLDSGVLLLEDDRVRPGHPLLGEAARHRAGTGELRELHRRIAHSVADPTSRALHLALATHGPDEPVAQIATAAVDIAARRGSNTTAATLADHALRLTDPAADRYPQRLVTAAERHHRRGDIARVVELLRGGIDRLSSPEHRGLAWFLLAECDENVSSEQAQAMRQQALEDLSDYSPALRSRLLAAVSTDLTITEVSALTDAETFAEAARTAAQESGDPSVAEESLAALCWSRALRGADIEALLRARAVEQPPTGVLIYDGVERIAAVSRIWRGDIPSARASLERLLQLAEERGEEESYLALRLHRCELDLRSGHWASAEAALNEWARELPVVTHERAYLTRCRALLQAGRGHGAFARDLALEALRPSGRGGAWNELEALRALGLSHLLLGDPEAAAEPLQRVIERTRAAGVANPGAFPVGADLAEAMALSGAAAEAAQLARELSAAATAQQHAWASAAADRAWGHTRLATGEFDLAVRHFERAADRFERLELPLDRSRSLIALGTALRRARRLREARESLEMAIASLEALESSAWADLARAELVRVGGRRRTGDEVLTASEQLIAQLVVQGLANKQVAQRLVISTSTVEAHLTRIYRKLGVASRTGLIRLLADQSVGLSPIPDGELPA